MKSKNFPLIPLLFLGTIIILSSCQKMNVSADASPNTPSETKITSNISEETATPIPEITVTATSTPIPTLNLEQIQLQQAEQTARDYFEKVASGDTDGAADLLSSFSLMALQMSRGDANTELQIQEDNGISWSSFEIIDSQFFDEQTILVHVTYAVSTKSVEEEAAVTPTPTGNSSAEVIDEMWPIRNESNVWLYNWDNLIDFRSLDVGDQTVNGITILPSKMLRFSDHIQLSMLIQNRTNDLVVFGQKNEILGKFFFSGQEVIAEKAQWILNPLRSIPDVTLEVKGFYENYPDSVEIRKFTNYDVAPWFTFQFN
jgi:hypothetical protein